MAHSREQLDLPDRKCPACGQTFRPYREWQRACSRRCRERTPRDESQTRPVAAVCMECGKAFTARSVGGGGHFKFCDECRPAVDRAAKDRKNASRRVENNPSRRAVNRRDLLRRAYGITPEQYDAMHKAQNGVCALCGEPPNPDGVRAASRLHVDHDHATGKVRALLCNHCNRGIGAFRDDPDLMQRASLYVWRHRNA